ncbi:MSMEG_1061 family FMN-dependent PPOX-type flavoprotein [Falsiroseomonas oryziterrae]|uniref:MSMEG_1061 family FMN-dependent PPOX-type flavoprotein n=1 Tax=Falsiroseomonas oryziterrae TaxID=2911368 RepID=UPI001F23C0CF|nr:MSMEG_1061 family FMN-dependent PPOX-type flavoprotein [Roseomonas sp. NPKOSM-4]
MDTLPPDPHAVTSLDALEALYPAPSELVRTKAGDRLGPESAAFVAASPFCLLGTIGPAGPHVTPRGDAPGFVAVEDARTLCLPDRRGNNRLDALRDILHDPRVALLFLVPGVGETLRVHGRARITTDPARRARHAADGKEPTSVIVVSVESVFMQCAKALIRSGLWEGRARPAGVPTLGRLVAEHTAGRHDGAALDARVAETYRTTLY